MKESEAVIEFSSLITLLYCTSYAFTGFYKGQWYVSREDIANNKGRELWFEL